MGRICFLAVVGPSLIVHAACGRIGFDAGSSIDDGRRSDAPIDAPPGALGPFGAWKTPTELGILNTSSQDFGPTFSPDANEVYLSSRWTGEAEIYRFTRADASSAWVADSPATQLNTSTNEEAEPSLTDDGLGIYFNRAGLDQMFIATRPDAHATSWSAPAMVETLYPNLAGFTSAEFAGDQRMVVERNGEIYEATRIAPNAPWNPPIALDIAGSVPCLRRDGLELLFEGTVTLVDTMSMPKQSVAIFRATRAATDQPFGAPERLSFGALDVAGVGDPELSHDGRQLIFSAQEILSDTKTYDIYITERDPQ